MNEINLNIWLCGFWAAVILFQVVSIPALIMKKNDLADVLWGPAFPISAIAAAYFGNEAGLLALDTRSLIILAFITMWAVRLFFYMGIRNLSKKSEDVRYNNWRKQWGKTAVWRSYLQVFVLQALILFLFLSPVLMSFSVPSVPMGILCYIGIAIWIFGFIIESIADEQLRIFKSKSENKGKLMTTGVWSWSRHPNYFGEVVQWWGIWLMTLELPLGWAMVVSPPGVTFLILKVSGVSMLEDVMRSRPGFDSYSKRTSRFFPKPPR